MGATFSSDGNNHVNVVCDVVDVGYVGDVTEVWQWLPRYMSRRRVWLDVVDIGWCG